MALQFVIGGAGSGKTRYLYDQALSWAKVHKDRSCFFIVPEQNTMQVQKELVRLHENHAIMNIDIVSFKRLACRVFEDLGEQLPVVLDDCGKSMVLRRVASMKKKKLTLYGGHLTQAGFIGELSAQISELYEYGIRARVLEEARADCEDPLLRAKLGDLCELYTGFSDFIKEKSIPAEEIPQILAQKLPAWERLKGSICFLDGFTGFTPTQYQLAGVLLEKAADVICCVSADVREDVHREKKMQQLFSMSSQLVCNLTELAIRRGVRVKPDILFEGRPHRRFAESPQLDFLERNLYRPYSETFRGALGQKENILIYHGRGAEDEIDFVCARLMRMVREEGLRYRDAAVVAGDLSAYGPKLARRFEEEGIPYFLDDKKSITQNPLVEFIRAALLAVRDFSYEAMFRYLKTGLACPMGEELSVFEERADRAENYVRALGIRGFKAWDNEWTRPARRSGGGSLKSLNAFREMVMGPLRPLRAAFKEDEVSIASVTEALRRFMETLSLKEKMEERVSFFLERNAPDDLVRAKEYSQVYGRVEELLIRVQTLLGTEPAQPSHYAQILDAGFEEIRIGVLPARVDEVMVGDLTRSRLQDVKVLFFVGVNEGVVPRKKSEGGILTDSDRQVLKAGGIVLAPGAREDGCNQKFYLYLMLSKPSLCLALTYASISPEGKSMRPSGLIGEVKRIFPGLKELTRESVSWPLLSLRDGREALAAGLREHSDEGAFLELYRYFYGNEKTHDEVLRLTQAAFYSYEEKGIGRAAAWALYGLEPEGSVTRLEKYASCAYAHFLRYGLELMERQEYELKSVDMGNLYHETIERAFERLKEEGRDISSLADGELRALSQECARASCAGYGMGIMEDGARNAYMASQVEQVGERTLWALKEQALRGDLSCCGAEVAFGMDENRALLKIPLKPEGNLLLQGRIDRVDRYEEGETIYVQIIDYKSGSTSFDLADIYAGLSLQLVVYLDVAMAAEAKAHPDKEVIPAGIFYYHIKDPIVKKEEAVDGQARERALLRALRLDGLVNSDPEVVRLLDRDCVKESLVIPVSLKDGLVNEKSSSVASTERFEQLRSYVRNRLKQAGEGILGGRTDIKPYKKGDGGGTACDYCPYHAVCGFDSKVAGFGYRRLKALKDEEIWKEIDRAGKR